MADIFSQPTDQDALALTHAIALQESGQGGKPNYNAVGDAGTSHGAYQWQPGNFESAAKEAGLDPTDRSPANQDKVAYYQVLKDKQAGLDPGQIASKWNSGSPNNWKDHSGDTVINGKTIHYDTPAYVKGVQKYYQQIKGSNNSSTGGFNPTPYSNPTGGSTGAGQFDFSGNTPTDTSAPTQDGSLGSQLTGRVNDASQAITDTYTGKQNILSGALQVGGAVGGAIGDVVNKGLELIPGVKQLEGVLGQGISSLAQTDTGKAILKSVQDFSTAHPELSKDIGAGFNILTAIPILRGIGVVKDIAMDSASLALKNAAEKAATKDLTATISRTVGGRKALTVAPDSVQTLIKTRAIPDIVDNKYSTKDAFSKLGDSIANIEDNELQPALEKADVAQTSSRIPLEQYKKEAIASAQDQLKDTGPIEKYFERLKVKYGDYPTLKQMNDAKRIVARNISEAGFNSPTYSVDKIVRSTLQKSVEDGAKALGLEDVSAINQKMANLIKAQNILKHIEGKPVKTGLIGGLLKDTATVGGEMAGNATGIPLAGTYIGREAGGYVGKKLAGLKNSVLNRTGPDAIRTSLGASKGKLTKGLVGTALQKTGNAR